MSKMVEMFKVVLHILGGEGTPKSAPGLLLALCLVITLGGTRDHMKGRGWKPGQLCVRQASYPLYYSASPVLHVFFLNI